MVVGRRADLLFGFYFGDGYGGNMTTDDATLLRAFASEGSQAAFTELVRRYLPIVFHAALRQCGGDRHRAEDVAQIVFADLARQADRLAERPALVGWLHTSTRYAAIQVVRAESRRQTREQEAYVMNEPNDSEAPATDWAKAAPLIDDALHLLGERDRAAVLLRFFQGCSFAEIGARLAMREDAARMRVARALEKLRAALARRGLVSTSAALSAALAGQVSASVPAGLVAKVSAAALAQVAVGGGVAAGGWFVWASSVKIAAGVSAGLIVGYLALSLLRDVGTHPTGAVGAVVTSESGLPGGPAGPGWARGGAWADARESDAAEFATAELPLADFIKRLEDPAHYAGLREELARMLERTHADVFEKLALGEIREAGLKRLLADRFLETFESWTLAEAGEADAPTLLGAFDQGAGDADERIRDFLGEDTYPRFEVLEETIPYRNQLRETAKRLAGTPHALRAAQIDAYAAAMREKARGTAAGDHWMAAVERLLPFQAPLIDETALEVATATLDPEQLAVFRAARRASAANAAPLVP